MFKWYPKVASHCRRTPNARMRPVRDSRGDPRGCFRGPAGPFCAIWKTFWDSKRHGCAILEPFWSSKLYGSATLRTVESNRTARTKERTSERANACTNERMRKRARQRGNEGTNERARWQTPGWKISAFHCWLFGRATLRAVESTRTVRTKERTSERANE